MAKPHLFTLRKMRHLYRTNYHWYRRHGKKLSSELRKEIEESLAGLDDALTKKDRSLADEWGQKVEEFVKQHSQKSTFVFVAELILAVVVALVIATIIRQTWFELYEIPTGSMRPTFREQDRLIVTKDSLGLNIPLQTGHWHFNPDNVQRSGVIVWSGENVDLPETTAHYFGVLPYTKRFIKRLMGKPGDTLYFYGGQVWGIDREGSPLSELRESPWMEGLDHLPFTYFEGRINSTTDQKGTTITYNHFGLPTARLQISSDGTTNRQIATGNGWEAENLESNEIGIRQYGDHWGMNNYGKSRIISGDDAPETLSPAIAYLQIFHHPNLSYPKPRFYRQHDGGYTALMTPLESFFPLQSHHLDAIRKHLYTARFIVQDGHAYRYSVAKRQHPPRDAIAVPGVPDGTYEFYQGEGFHVGKLGVLETLANNHPLQPTTDEQLILLFNLGIELSEVYDPTVTANAPVPSRFAYYREGALYAGRGVIATADDPALITFVEGEKTQAEQSSSRRPYHPFIDEGPPIKDGKIDVEKIRTYGLKIPEDHYVVLGDNHAMSADSRMFGFLPQDNLEGTPSIIIWPMQDRFGTPLQAPYPWITTSRLIIWGIVFVLIVAWRLYRRRQDKQPFQKL